MLVIVFRKPMMQCLFPCDGGSKCSLISPQNLEPNPWGILDSFHVSFSEILLPGRAAMLFTDSV